MKRLLTLCLLVACSKTPAPTGPVVPAGLAAVPPRLAYLCVTPGCEEVQTAEINVRGSRRVAIKRVLLAGGGAADFTFTASEQAPFIVGGGSSFSVDVKYTPKGAPAPGEARLLVTYTDASPEESPDRLPAGELVVPLVRRIVGEPVLSVKPRDLSFGVVTPGMNKMLPLYVSNEGFGNLVLEIKSADAGHPDVKAPLPMTPAMGPDAGFELPVTYTPTTEAYLHTELTVLATAAEVPPGVVSIEGTSLSYPKLQLEPQGDIDFGLVGKGKQRMINRQLVNQGGVDLIISTITVADTQGAVKLMMPMTQPLTLKPLQRVPLAVLIDGMTPGEVDATITFGSTDPTNPTYVWHLTGTITDPKISVTPDDVQFGNLLTDGGIGSVPIGWVITKPVEIKNIGFGPLSVKNITLVAGTSNLFTLMKVPTLPVVLEKDGRIAVDVQFRAETMASFDGIISVESDDAAKPFFETPMHASVGACGAATCPIANGTPSCLSGSCQVGMCNTGYYDTDSQAATGCECREIGTDPGEFCMSSYYAGNLTDETSSATQFTGLIATQSDVDLVVVHGEDQTGFFSDAYDIKIRLDSSDPGIRMCVYTHKGGHGAECYFSGEVCPGNRSFRDDGSLGPDDDADYIIKVFRDPQSAPTCTAYTLFMSNAR